MNNQHCIKCIQKTNQCAKISPQGDGGWMTAKLKKHTNLRISKALRTLFLLIPSSPSAPFAGE